MAKRGQDSVQVDLFEAAPPPVAAQDLQIVPNPTAPLGKEQLTFNRLIGQVQSLRTTLAEWAAFETSHRAQAVAELVPLQCEIGVRRRATILTVAAILRGTAGGGIASNAERRSLNDYLMELLRVHLDEVPEDVELVAVHDEFADTSFAEQQEMDHEVERSMAREMTARMFGVELDDDELDGSPEEIIAAALAKARQAEAERAERQRSRGRGDAKPRDEETRREAREEKAAQEVSQSVREVYRKLASALHPDRAADEADRARRHEAMQRVNTAYEARDLLGLLTLQLEIEQIDSDHLARVSKQRLRHYNAVLRDQLRELQQELAAVQNHFRQILDDPHASVSQANVRAALKRDVADLKRTLRDFGAHHEMLLHAAERRRWLKEYAKERRAEEREQAHLIDAFVDGFADRSAGGPDAGFEQRIAAFYAHGLDPFGDDADAFFGDFDPFGAPTPAGAARRRSRKKRRR